uniref:Uncharacterized protein n=1 Tax=Triticum urartu TaxID=4572 RepID=A0A8R7Q2M9_TRIUA
MQQLTTLSHTGSSGATHACYTGLSRSGSRPAVSALLEPSFAAGTGRAGCARQTGQVACAHSQTSTHPTWNECLHPGKARTASPSCMALRHTAHSSLTSLPSPRASALNRTTGMAASAALSSPPPPALFLAGPAAVLDPVRCTPSRPLHRTYR